MSKKPEVSSGRSVVAELRDALLKVGDYLDRVCIELERLNDRVGALEEESKTLRQRQQALEAKSRA